MIGPLSLRPLTFGPLSLRPLTFGPLSLRPLTFGPLQLRPLTFGRTSRVALSPERCELDLSFNPEEPSVYDFGNYFCSCDRTWVVLRHARGPCWSLVVASLIAVL